MSPTKRRQEPITKQNRLDASLCVSARFINVCDRTGVKPSCNLVGKVWYFSKLWCQALSAIMKVHIYNMYCLPNRITRRKTSVVSHTTKTWIVINVYVHHNNIYVRASIHLVTLITTRIKRFTLSTMKMYNLCSAIGPALETLDFTG